MTRNTVLVFVVLGAAVGLFTFSSAAQRLRNDDSTAATSVAAGPQARTLRWREPYGRPGERIVFGVKELEVVPDGWRADVSIANETSAAWEIGDPKATLDRSFGLMLFATGKAAELAERNEQRTLPTVRPAERYEPPLPEILEPGTSWDGVISARGSLAAGTWARLVFGALVAIGPPPEGLEDRVVWITDDAVRLTR